MPLSPASSHSVSTPGVWKTYGVDSNNVSLTGVTVGNGTRVGRWWTPATVIAAPATTAFLCILDIYFLLGSTSTVDGLLRTTNPTAVDGTINDIQPVGFGVTDLVPIVVVAASHGDSQLGFQNRWGEAIVASSDPQNNSQPWGPAFPNAGGWIAGDAIHATATFMAKFVAED